MLTPEIKIIIEDLQKQKWVKNLLKYGDMYIVGGCVRDALRKQKVKDIDVVVDGPEISIIEGFLVDFGKVNLVGESFKVIKFRPHGHIGEDYDIAVPRKDKKTGSGHKDFEIVTEGVSIEEDLKRRDFTVNSIAVNIESGEMIDLFNGVKDLGNGLIKATDPQAFADDALRILRGIQFAARFGFKIDSGTKKLMKQYAPELKHITGERIFDELQKIILKSGDTQIALNLIHETDVDLALFDKKMLRYDKGFEKLDMISFYYVLGLLGDVDPEQFYLKKLKGHALIGKAIKTLDTLITAWPHTQEESDKRYLLFKAIQKSPQITESVVFPPDAEEILKEMKAGETPMQPRDIKITGDDIKKITGLPEGRELGALIEKIQKNALMNVFNWKSRDACVDYVSGIFYH